MAKMYRCLLYDDYVQNWDSKKAGDSASYQLNETQIKYSVKKTDINSAPVQRTQYTESIVY